MYALAYEYVSSNLHLFKSWMLRNFSQIRNNLDIELSQVHFWYEKAK